MAGLAKTFIGRTDDEAVARDVENARGTTMADRARILVSLCEMAAESISQHPDPQKALAWQDPIPPASEALLQRLRDRVRRDRA